MAGERIFKVQILGNADGAITAFKKLAKEGKDSIDQVRGVAGKIGDAFDVVKKGAFIAVGAFTALAGAATAAVYAAAEDEKSQKLLQAQLERSTGATLAQVQATESFIEKAMMATGIADDELRPAFGNLARATGDLEKSQRLFTLALDISAATGRDLEAVTLGLGRAATGNIGALTRLGIPLDENTKKSKDFGAALVTLETQFGGAAATAADTFAGRVKILKTSFGEVVETVGYLLLPAFEKLVGFLQDRIVPALQNAVRGFKEEGLSGALKYFLAALGPFSIKVIDSIEAISLSVITLGGHLDIVAAIIAASAFVATPGKALDIFNSIVNRSEKAAQGASAKFDALRLSIINTGNALNFANNKLSPIIDQTDKIGTKVLPKAKESTDDWSNSLDNLKTKGGGAAKTVETAAQKLEKYTSALKESTSAQKSFTSAQKTSVGAQQDLNKANTDLASAQENFNRVVAGFGADSKEAKAAQRDLDKAQRGVAQAGFRVEEAVFAVADAEKNLAEVRADPTSSAQAIREAEIRLAQAKLAVSDATDSQRDATDSLTKAQDMLNEAVDGAVKGSDTYNQFLKILEDAKERQIDASDRAREAADRETEALLALADAIAKVAEAARFNPNLAVPVLPTVPAPTGAGGGGGFTGRPEQGSPSIVIQTGIGTNGVEAGRQIVEVLQQYSKLDRNAIADLVVTR